MKTKSLIIFFTFLSWIVTSATAQQPRSSIDDYKPATYVALAGEGMATNYGFAVSVPVFWIENRLKLTPLAGLFWHGFSDDGFDFNPALGARILYYFHKQAYGKANINSFYAGAGGMGSVNTFTNSEATERSRAGAIFGYTFSSNSGVQFSPELQLGVNESGSFRPAVGLVIQIGR